MLEKTVLIMTNTALGSLSKILPGEYKIQKYVLKKNKTTGTKGLNASLADLM